MTSEIEKEYNKLCEKFKLPKFKELDEEFEISTFENASFLLRNILRKAYENLEFYTTILSDVLQPDTSSLSSMHEIRFFTDKEKEGMYRLFKKMMKTNRTLIELILEHDERKEADFLSSFFAEWLDVKKELLSYLIKMKNLWDKETSIEEDLGYLG